MHVYTKLSWTGDFGPPSSSLIHEFRNFRRPCAGCLLFQVVLPFWSVANSGVFQSLWEPRLRSQLALSWISFPKVSQTHFQVSVLPFALFSYLLVSTRPSSLSQKLRYKFPHYHSRASQFSLLPSPPSERLEQATRPKTTSVFFSITVMSACWMPNRPLS